MAECDKVLAVAAEELRVLRKRLLDSDYQRANTTASATDLTAELTGLEAEIGFLTPLVATLPADTDQRSKRVTELRRATDRRDELTDRQGARGAVALLSRELEQNQAQVQLTETEVFVAEVTARRATL